jgi:hypothetical protein
MGLFDRGGAVVAVVVEGEPATVAVQLHAPLSTPRLNVPESG